MGSTFCDSSIRKDYSLKCGELDIKFKKQESFQLASFTVNKIFFAGLRWVKSPFIAVKYHI